MGRRGLHGLIAPALHVASVMSCSDFVARFRIFCSYGLFLDWFSFIHTECCVHAYWRL